MNKDVIRELMDLRANISRANITPYVMRSVINSIIIDLMDEGRENETCCTCEDCPAVKKMDELESRTEMFKNLIVEVTTDEIIEAEKMARGGTD